MEPKEKELTVEQTLQLFNVIVGLLATMILGGLSTWLMIAGICYCAHSLWNIYHGKHIHICKKNRTTRFS